MRRRCAHAGWVRSLSLGGRCSARRCRQNALRGSAAARVSAHAVAGSSAAAAGAATWVSAGPRRVGTLQVPQGWRGRSAHGQLYCAAAREVAACGGRRRESAPRGRKRALPPRKAATGCGFTWGDNAPGKTPTATPAWMQAPPRTVPATAVMRAAASARAQFGARHGTDGKGGGRARVRARARPRRVRAQFHSGVIISCWRRIFSPAGAARPQGHLPQERAHPVAGCRSASASHAENGAVGGGLLARL